MPALGFLNRAGSQEDDCAPTEFAGGEAQERILDVQFREPQSALAGGTENLEDHPADRRGIGRREGMGKGRGHHLAVRIHGKRPGRQPEDRHRRRFRVAFGKEIQETHFATIV